jgi:hypothetical protein
MLAGMLESVDPFLVFRRSLLIVVSSYTLVLTVQAFWRWRIWGRGSHRGVLIVKRYALVSLLRVRMGKFAWDAIQIIVMCCVLVWLLWHHG